jgi:hypothetical protein
MHLQVCGEERSKAQLKVLPHQNERQEPKHTIHGKDASIVDKHVQGKLSCLPSFAKFAHRIK